MRGKPIQNKTFFVNAVVVVAAAGVEVVAGLLPVAAAPSHAAVLAVPDPHGCRERRWIRSEIKSNLFMRRGKGRAGQGSLTVAVEGRTRAAARRRWRR